MINNNQSIQSLVNSSSFFNLDNNGDYSNDNYNNDKNNKNDLLKNLL